MHTTEVTTLSYDNTLAATYVEVRDTFTAESGATSLCLIGYRVKYEDGTLSALYPCGHDAGETLRAVLTAAYWQTV